ncbi:acyl-ACP--UDP-N-acetylglucosamine O-acyltransferase [Pontivivens ytuae]|uniref:Acyl-[acyl-carrier-protein]--UDP-N-acetylglucosamine O-acyltransferase n=1 Tax=Pontivivens ytuae TaxID=2789856 RepID=A0A7S9LRJ8_9RHOB|nr:acyl-ACP--UDP-N-acetylglucosamine O-acyltransferase [Pontivivens ytuae]QPH53986.1 acyl-ACP--UDP-N-acetylglucosamine O-acyltransferase [Pontivivens ytuae]
MAIADSAIIHPTAIVEDGAEIGPDTRVGPYCMIGPKVRLGAGLELFSHVVVAGDTAIGDGTRIWPFASVGHQPQDLKYAGEATRLEIGARNMIRESTSINPGTEGGGGLTSIGDDNLFMLGSHVGHDCKLGNRIVLANNAAIAGHCTVEDNVIIGGQSGVHQFCHLGRGAMIGAVSMVTKDVIPYGSIVGNRGALAGLNIVGLKRRGVERAQLHALRAAYQAIFVDGAGTLQERAARTRDDHPDNALVQEITGFILADHSRSVATP